jgi:hypothetical protein
MSKPEAIIMAAIHRELQGEIRNAVTDAFREGLCTAAQMVRVCATKEIVRESLRTCPETALETIAISIETLSRELLGGTP